MLDSAPALAIPIFKNAASIRHTPGGQSPVQCLFDQNLPSQAHQQLQLAVQGVQKDFNIQLTGQCSISFFVPPGCGVGMSAAFSVCLLKLAQHHTSISRAAGLAWLQKKENFYHGGQASGVDHHTIFNQQPTLLHNKKITILPHNFVPDSILEHCVVFFTGVPAESTAQMIQHTQANRTPHDIAKLTTVFLNFLETPNQADLFVSTINTAGEWLESIEAVNPAVQKKLTTFRARGGGIKICGAGGFSAGSGFGVAFHHDPSVLTQWLASSGFGWCSLQAQLGPNNRFVS